MKINKKIVSVSLLWLSVVGVEYSFPSKKNVSRDPFYLKSRAIVGKTHKKVKKSGQEKAKLFLEGILSMDDHLAATIYDGKESVVVVVGDCIGGCVVKSISDNKVVLAHGKYSKILVLD